MNSMTLADRIRPQAVALRRAGKSRREIKEILGVRSNTTLNDALAGEPPPAWTRRPRAKDDMRAKARHLREQGNDYEQIAGELGVSKSSVSLWVRDIPRPERLSYEECRKRAAEGVRRYWETELPIRQARREAVRASAAAEIGTSLKKHNPRTVRKNVGDAYHGCLRIDVLGSADLYRRIEGWAEAVMNRSGRTLDATDAGLTVSPG